MPCVFIMQIITSSESF